MYVNVFVVCMEWNGRTEGWPYITLNTLTAIDSRFRVLPVLSKTTQKQNHGTMQQVPTAAPAHLSFPLKYINESVKMWTLQISVCFACSRPAGRSIIHKYVLISDLSVSANK